MDQELTFEVPVARPHAPQKGCGNAAGCGCAACRAADEDQEWENSQPADSLAWSAQQAEAGLWGDAMATEWSGESTADEEWEGERGPRRRPPTRGTSGLASARPQTRPTGRSTGPQFKPLPGQRPVVPRRPRVPTAGVFFQPPVSTVCSCDPAPNPGSETVRWVQSTLNLLRGFNLPVNGVMTAASRSALRAFQRDEGLPPDGIAGPQTIRALSGLREEPASSPMPGPGAAAVSDSAAGDSEVAAEQELEFAGSTCPAPSGVTLRQRIVQAARCEWGRWNQGRLSESQPEAVSPLMDYWTGYSPSGLSTDNARAAIRDQTAWSAAFISFVMRRAGAGDAFRYSAGHSYYVAAAKVAATRRDAGKFWAFEITAVKPEIGDLICRDRNPKQGAPCGGTTFENVVGGRATHSDIVVDIQPGYLVVLGGNTGQAFPHTGQKVNTVGQRKVLLDSRGFVLPQPSQGCRYFAIVKPPGNTQPLPEPSSPSSGLPSPSGPPAAPVQKGIPARFAQRVLNATLGERLDVDGIAGRHTTTAVKLFQCGLALPITGRLDAVTLIALTQAALEEMHQQSLFPRRGVMDEVTKQRISEFRRSRGLGDQPVVDEALMQSL